MKVKVIKASLNSYWYTNEIGKVFEVVDYSNPSQPSFAYHVKDCKLGNLFNKDDVEIINEEKAMNKNDLRTGMRVVHGKHPRESGFAIVVKDLDQLVFQDGGWNYLSSYDDQGKNGGVWDITAVYAAPDRDIFNFDRCGDLIWQKVEKSPEQLQLAKVMSKISDLQAEAAKLQELIK